MSNSRTNEAGTGLPWTPDFETYPITAAIADASVDGDAVRIAWSDGKTSAHHALWLRENSPDGRTIHAETREMLVGPLDIPGDIAPVDASVDQFGALVVAWSDDGDASRYHPGWLRDHAWFDGGEANVSRGSGIVTWTARSLTPPPTFDGAQALKDDHVFAAWLTALRDYGIARLVGLPAEENLLEAVASRIGPIRDTNFDRIFRVVTKGDPDSNAYTPAALVPHMDLATREAPPGLQFLFCRVNSAAGGEGLYADGIRIAEDLRQEAPDDFEALTTVPWEFRNRAKDTDYRAAGPIIQLDADGAPVDVRFTPWLRAPLKAPVDVQRRAYRAVRAFLQRAQDDAYVVRVTYAPGDLVAFDNRRVLHGRSGYRGGERQLDGCYMDRDDLHSKIRTLSRSR